MPGNAIFISYRRADTGGYASRLRDYLVPAFGQQRIFIDVGITPGTPWKPALERAISSSGVVLAVIGRSWLTDRLVDPDDTLRQELEMAVALRVPIIPVLIGTAEMPPPDKLPGSLRVLPSLQAVRVTEEGWSDDVRRLQTALWQILPPVRRPAPPPPPKPSLLRRLLVTTTVVAVLVVMAGVGFVVIRYIADNFGFNADITISPLTGPPGTNITVSGTGFPPNSTVHVAFERSVKNPSSRGDGSFEATITVPPQMIYRGDWPVDASSGNGHATEMFTVTDP